MIKDQSGHIFSSYNENDRVSGTSSTLSTLSGTHFVELDRYRMPGAVAYLNETACSLMSTASCCHFRDKLCLTRARVIDAFNGSGIPNEIKSIAVHSHGPGAGRYGLDTELG